MPHWLRLRLPNCRSSRMEVLHLSPEIVVDVRGLPGDAPSDVPQVLSTISLLMKKTGVCWCVVGDVLLAYYCVPQITGDIEICVPSENLDEIEGLFNASTDFCFRFRPRAAKSSYSQHVAHFPRFRIIGMNQCFCLVTGSHYGLNPRAFADLLYLPQVGFPLLPLPHYVQGLASMVAGQSTSNPNFRIQIEYLIDGMDIDKEWCCLFLDGPAKQYVWSKSTPIAKKNRMGQHPKYDGNLTTYIHDQEERQRVLSVIGRVMENHAPDNVPILTPPTDNNYTFPIQIMSDLHLEVSFCGSRDVPGYDAFDCKPFAPVLALLGDIGLVTQEKLFGFLRCQLLKYEKVFFVMGNHEFYHSSYEDAKCQMNIFVEQTKKQRDLDSSQGEFILLDQTRYDLNADITILGCTLWSHIPPAASEEVGLRLNDFKRIHQWSVERHNAAHESDVAWLDSECAKIRAAEPGRRVVVLTHHAPAVSGTSAPQHEGSTSSSLRTAFATDMSGRPCWGPPVKLWGFGHTHFCCDFMSRGVRIVSNQRGYEGFEAPRSLFRDDLVLFV